MHRTMWLALCAALMATTFSAAPAAQGSPTAQDSARRAGGDMKVWSYNITGAGTNKQNRNDINNGGAPRAVKPVLSRINGGQRPHVIALQEVCKTQAAYLRPRLKRAGYKVHWRATKDQPRCAAYKNNADGVPTAHGDLVAVPRRFNPTSYAYDFDLATPSPVGEGLTCLGFTKQSRFVVACSTHISGTNDQRTAKTYRMRRDEIEPWAQQGYGIVIAGDFNTKPGQEPMKNLYHRNGVLSEGDRTRNRWTHQNRKAPFAKRKIDYVFMSNNYFPKRSYVSTLDTKRDYSYHRFFTSKSRMR